MKLTPPGMGTAASVGRRRSPPKIPDEVIAELRERDYLALVCGHYSAKDTQAMYASFRPKGELKHFCEKCGSWETLKKTKVRDTPENPLF